MSGRLLGRFLADRAPVALLLLLNTALLLLLFGLLLSYTGSGVHLLGTGLVEGALLSLALLLLYLLIDLLRWWPFARQAERLAQEATHLDALANLPPGATADQSAARELLLKLHALAVTDRNQLQAAHSRHLSFMNLWVHQMKTPVSAISLIAQQAGATEIEEEAAKLNDGLELVLNMARLDDFAIDYQIRRIDLTASVRTVINSRKKQFIRSGIFPEVEAEPDCVVLTDEKWNRFVIDQIVSNALKYATQAGKPDQRLRFSLKHQGDQVVLTIADQGPGIPPQDLPRLYEPFFTGENGRRFAQATGIGLYLVKQVIDHLGHAIAITSVEGEGTTVVLTYRSLQN
ncbi:MAG: sensor histidine kinase [Mycobacterium leprae]